jgi:Ala-tRNA(Pro) deacylase
MNIPTTLLEFLNEHDVKYELLHHPERYTAQELAQVEGVRGSQHAKVVMIKSNGTHQMAVLPSDRMVDIEKLEKSTGEEWKIEMEDEFKGLFPDCETGAMPPFGNLYGMETRVDRSLADNDTIVFEAGTHTDAIKMSYRDYETLAKPMMSDFSIKGH